MLSLSGEERKRLTALIEEYEVLGGQTVRSEEELPELGTCVRVILGISDKEREKISSPNELAALVSGRLGRLNADRVRDICFVITSVKEGEK